MMKTLIVLTIIALTFVMAISAFAAETDNVIQPGDANADGEINIKDVVLLAQIHSNPRSESILRLYGTYRIYNSRVRNKRRASDFL